MSDPLVVTDGIDPAILVPDEHGLDCTVVGLWDLANALANQDEDGGMDLHKALEDTGFDTIDPKDPDAIAKVAEYNRTGDINKYWGLT